MEAPNQTEAELESFRQQWRQEVSARSRNVQRPTPYNAATEAVRSSHRRTSTAPSSTPKPVARRVNANEGFDETEPRAYHDLPNKDADLKLGAADHGLVRGSSGKEPQSALEHYEKAVEKESLGSLGDSLKLYRRAFKLDDRVHEKYKNKHFPPQPARPQQPASANAPTTAATNVHQPAQLLPPSISELVEEFSRLAIPRAEPPTDASPPPPCPIAELPEEILINILQWSAISDLACFSRLPRVCKRFAYLIMTEESIWKRITLGSEYGFAAMHYDFACDLLGKPLPPELDDLDHGLEQDSSGPTLDAITAPSFSDITQSLLKNQYASSWRQLFRSRPRIRFNGCYISTVNYTRPGAASTTQTTWGTPVHIVTYFRYLRFFRDGTVVSLLTTTEPGDVVHHLTKDNMHRQHGSVLPSAVMKDALKGRWRLSGPGDGAISEETEGDVHIETEGVVPKYMWKMHFALGSAGRGTRNNKLSWKGFWSYNKLTDDWGEFGLKNDKPYYWSRVKSFGTGY